jgi:hypothetical protein
MAIAEQDRINKLEKQINVTQKSDLHKQMKIDQAKQKMEEELTDKRKKEDHHRE